MTADSNWTFLTNANKVCVKIIEATLRAVTSRRCTLLTLFRYIAVTGNGREYVGILFDGPDCDHRESVSLSTLVMSTCPRRLRGGASCIMTDRVTSSVSEFLSLCPVGYCPRPSLHPP